MNNQNTKLKKRGRPLFNVTWPNGSFSTKDVHKALDGKLSNVSVQLKINKAVSEGTLQKVGTSRQSTGRPTSLYKKSETQTPSNHN